MTTTFLGAIEQQAQVLQERMGLEKAPKAIGGGFADLFENGVLATVRVGAERFGYSVHLSDLGIVPTRVNSKSKTQAAIDAVLRTSQRASLLPRDQMWYQHEDGRRLPIPRPENSERQIRLLFPTRYEDQKEVLADLTPDERKQRANAAISSPTLWAIPMNGMTFIPESSFDRWNADFQKAKAAHAETANLIVENYDRLRVASVRHYERIALDVYNRILQTSPDLVNQINALEFTRRWKRSVLRAWPTKEEILANFTVDAKFYWVPLPSRVEQDRIAAQQIRDEYENRQRDVRSSIAIVKAVQETQKGQVHELTISYVKTILERTEHVFLGFLNFLDGKDRNPSPAQLNAVIKVVDMIKVLGSGIGSFDEICQQAEKIEAYINIHKTTVTTVKGRKKASAFRDAQALLPSALADAVSMMRLEAESLIGFDARRTLYSDQNPHDICSSIWSEKDSEIDTVLTREIRSEYEDDTEIDAILASFPDSSDDANNQEETFSRVIRPIEQ